MRKAAVMLFVHGLISAALLVWCARTASLAVTIVLGLLMLRAVLEDHLKAAKREEGYARLEHYAQRRHRREECE